MSDQNETMSCSDAMKLVLEHGARVARREWRDKYRDGWSAWVSCMHMKHFPGVRSEYIRFHNGNSGLGFGTPSVYQASTGPSESDPTSFRSNVTFEWTPSMDDIVATDWYVIEGDSAAWTNDDGAAK